MVHLHHKPFISWSFLSYQFAPTLASFLLVLLAFPLLISLGIWQLHRADYKLGLQKKYQARMHSSSLYLNELTPAFLQRDDLQFYPIKMQGYFDHQHQFLLENKIFNHQNGYEVYSIFNLPKLNQAVLVDRGWIPKNPSQLSILNLPSEVVMVQGSLREIPRSFHLGHYIYDKTWPKKVIDIDKIQIEKQTAVKLLPFIVLLDPNQENGFVRDWSPMKLNVNMHYGYAFQWFALAGTSFVIFLIVNTQRCSK